MRDISVKKTDYIKDQKTGSTLEFGGYQGGREGGVVYLYKWRPDPKSDAFEFSVVFLHSTDFAARQNAKREGIDFSGLPIFSKEYEAYLSNYIDEHGANWLVGDFTGPFEKVPENKREQFMSTFCRLFFGLRSSRHPDSATDSEVYAPMYTDKIYFNTGMFGNSLRPSMRALLKTYFAMSYAGGR